MTKSIEDRQVNCYFCGLLFDERDAVPADKHNNGDGGSICMYCLGSQPAILPGKLDESCKIETGTVAMVHLPNSSVLDAVDFLIRMDATQADAPVSYINAEHFRDQMQDLDGLENTKLSPIQRDALVILKQVAAKLNMDLVTDIQFYS